MTHKNFFSGAMGFPKIPWYSGFTPPNFSGAMLSGPKKCATNWGGEFTVRVSTVGMMHDKSCVKMYTLISTETYKDKLRHISRLTLREPQ